MSEEEQKQQTGLMSCEVARVSCMCLRTLRSGDIEQVQLLEVGPIHMEI